MDIWRPCVECVSFSLSQWRFIAYVSVSSLLPWWRHVQTFIFVSGQKSLTFELFTLALLS